MSKITKERRKTKLTAILNPASAKLLSPGRVRASSPGRWGKGNCSLTDGLLTKWWEGNKKKKIHAREGDWKKKIVQRRSEEKKSCRVNYTVGLTNYTRLKWQLGHHLYTAVLISWYYHSSPIDILNLSAETHGKHTKKGFNFAKFSGGACPQTP